MKKRHNKMIAILSMVLVLGIGSATVFAEKAPEITESISEELERNGLPEGNISKEKNSNPYGICLLYTSPSPRD